MLGLKGRAQAPGSPEDGQGCGMSEGSSPHTVHVALHRTGWHDLGVEVAGSRGPGASVFWSLWAVPGECVEASVGQC